MIRCNTVIKNVTVVWSYRIKRLFIICVNLIASKLRATMVRRAGWKEVS